MSDSAGVTRPPSRSTRQKQKTRDRLIRAAMSVMAAKGADAATINDITEAADVGFGSFYNHFDSKEDILEAATAGSPPDALRWIKTPPFSVRGIFKGRARLQRLFRCAWQDQLASDVL
jgi:Bacterial regulatory proteins, tetR family